MSSIFSLPVAQYHQPQSTRRSQYRNKKRKRNVEEADDSDTNASSKETKTPRAASQSSEYSAVISPDQRRQFRIAGQPFDEDPPPQPFPHARAKVKSQSRRDHATPDIGTSSASGTRTLHQQHLAAITAILHRTLADRDFARAGRVLGLLLRDEVAGQPLDIRNEGRWGIGAEILLRQGVQKSVQDASTGAGSDNEELEVQERRVLAALTRDGFESAKRYYERLIIQHPFDRKRPTSTGAINFYPAMFGLWVYVVQAEDKRVPKQQTVDQVREIAARMNSCMAAAPYSDFAELVRLRGMVATWQADLIEDLIASVRSADMDVDTGVDEGSPPELSEPQTTAPGDVADLKIEGDRARSKAQEMAQKLHGEQSKVD